MNLDIEQIAKTFISHNFDETFPYMADGIKWNVIGRHELLGRDAVMAQCAEAKKFLATVATTFTKLEVSRAGNTVFVEGACLFRDPKDQSSRVASCDVFQFSDGRLVEITSYVVDLKA
jgi:hypothetical protein